MSSANYVPFFGNPVFLLFNKGNSGNNTQYILKQNNKIKMNVMNYQEHDVIQELFDEIENKNLVEVQEYLGNF
jgi:hypothetical protein